MKKGHLTRTIIIWVIIFASLYSLYPTFRLMLLSDAKIEEMKKNDEQRKKLEKWMSRSIKLGLDLKGGVHLVLETDVANVTSSEEKRNIINQALQVVENRIDEFGVAEPIVQKIGENRILVQLPGIKDESRAKSIIGRTAFLEFKIVKEGPEVKQIIDELDMTLSRLNAGKPIVNKDDSLNILHPFSKYLLNRGNSELAIEETNYETLKQMLKTPEVDTVLKKYSANIAFSRSDEIVDSNTNTIKKFRSIYFLNSEASLTGASIADAQVAFGGDLDAQAANKPYVSLSFTKEGAKEFETVTGNNIHRRLAVVLDSIVNSAPTIQDKIRGGQARITGNFTVDEASDLAVVLRSGALPVPVKIVEERTVGPTLGKDSIEKGLKSTLLGTLIVVIFMIIYYTAGGIIADIALLFNLLFILAILALFNASLTLPGIAGLALTMGMAVDANILIFERMREELKAGKTALAAVDSGYKKAFSAIFDSNITTMMTAAILYQYGTGPIKGFAVTLSIGLVCNLFTAIVMTRAIYDFFFEKIGIKKIYIG